MGVPRRCHRRNWVVGGKRTRGPTAGLLHLDLANAKRQGVFVIVENLNRKWGAAVR